MTLVRPRSAAYVRWQDEAECLGATGFDFAPYKETRSDLERVRMTWCNVCQVRPECLLYALLNRAEGYWGGTDTSERRKLSVRRNRARCPISTCRGKAVVSLQADDQHTVETELCLRCGMSWPAGTALVHGRQ